MDHKIPITIDYDFLKTFKDITVVPYLVHDEITGEITYPYVYKAGSKKELENYKHLSESHPDGIAKFLPKFYLGEAIDQNKYFNVQHTWCEKPHKRGTVLVLENIAENLENFSWMDIKLGQYHGRQSEYLSNPQKFVELAIKRKTLKKCFGLIDVVIKDQNTGEIIEQIHKNHDIDYYKAGLKFFTDSEGNINVRALTGLCDEINNMQNYFLSSELEYEYRDLSLFVAIDHKNSIYKVKLVDFDRVDKLIYDQDLFPLVYRDENGILKDGAMIKALENIKNVFQSLIDII